MCIRFPIQPCLFVRWMLALDLDEPMRLSRPPAVQGLGKWRTLVDGEAHFGKAAVAKGRAEDGLGPPDLVEGVILNVVRVARAEPLDVSRVPKDSLLERFTFS